MWYVEAKINVGGNVEIWECLTREQSREIHSSYSQRGAYFVRSGIMGGV